MLRVRIYLKSGAVAEFEASAIAETPETANSHPKFRLDFPPSDTGGPRLVYLDRDDVSAVVVVEEPDAGREPGAREAAVPEPVVVPETIRQEVGEVLAVAAVGAAGTRGPARRTRAPGVTPPPRAPRPRR